MPFGIKVPPPLMSCTKVTYDTEQSESVLSESGQDDVEPSSGETLYSEPIGSDIGPDMQAAALPKRSKLGDDPKAPRLLSLNRHIGPGRPQRHCLYVHSRYMPLKFWQPGQFTRQ